MRIDAAIVAGGQGSRMGGVRKSLIEVEGRRIVDRQLDVLRPLVEVVWIIDRAEGGHPEIPGARLIRDLIPDVGPLGAIHAAFDASSADAVLVFGCDWPHLDARVVELLRDHPSEAWALVPRIGARPQPLHARYRRELAPVVARMIGAGERRLLGLLEQCDVTTEYLEEPALRAIDAGLRCMTNINTPEDLG